MEEIKVWKLMKTIIAFFLPSLYFSYIVIHTAGVLQSVPYHLIYVVVTGRSNPGSFRPESFQPSVVSALGCFSLIWWVVMALYLINP